MLYIGVSEWTAQQIQDGRPGRGTRHSPDLQPAAALHAVAGDRGRCRTGLRLTRHLQIVFSPIAQGVLTGKPQTGRAAADRLAGNQRGGADTIKRWMWDDVLKRVQQLEPIAEEAEAAKRSWQWPGCSRTTRVSSAIIGASRPEQVYDNAAAAGSSSRKICWPRSMKCWIR